MKTLFIILALLSFFLCGFYQAHAKPTALCFCAGVEGRESAGCGSGAVGGNKGQWVTIKSTDVGNYLKDSYTLWQFSMGWHARDPVTGWYCYDKATWY